MPPKKASGTQANKVSDFFSPTAPSTNPRDKTNGDNMALTKTDLAAMLRDFKKELRNELRQDMATAMDQLCSDLTEHLTGLQQDVDSIGTRVMDLETQHQDQDQQATSLREDVQDIKEQLRLSHLKAEDLENWSRWENIRIRDLEEGAEGPDLAAFVEGLFAEVLSPKTMKIKLDRVHRVGPLRATEKTRPRDILAKFHSFQTKEGVLQAARAKPSISFQEHSCSLYQDLAPATLARRQQFRALTNKLREDHIRYRWTYPFGLGFVYKNKQRHITDLQQGLELLGLPTGHSESPQATLSDSRRGVAATTGWSRTARRGGAIAEGGQNEQS